MPTVKPIINLLVAKQSKTQKMNGCVFFFFFFLEFDATYGALQNIRSARVEEERHIRKGGRAMLIGRGQ